MKKYLLIAIGLFFIGSANATVITSNTTNITTTAQTFSDTVTLLDIYENIVIDVEAKGDYGATEANEFLSFKIDGMELFNWCVGSTAATRCPNTGVTFTSTNSSAIDYTIIGSIQITKTIWDLVSADDILNISWENGSGVNNSSLGGSDFVTYSISGDIVNASSPSVALLFMIAIAGFGVSRRHRN
jgi:hypothetical protein